MITNLPDALAEIERLQVSLATERQNVLALLQLRSETVAAVSEAIRHVVAVRAGIREGGPPSAQVNAERVEYLLMKVLFAQDPPLVGPQGANHDLDR